MNGGMAAYDSTKRPWHMGMTADDQTPALRSGMSSKSARARRREERKREAARLDEARQAERYVAAETIACAAVDLTGLAWSADDALEALAVLRDDTARIHRVWGDSRGADELCVLAEEIRASVRGCLERVGELRTRIQRMREREDHFHLVGDRATRLVVAEEVRHVDACVPDDDPILTPAERGGLQDRRNQVSRRKRAAMPPAPAG